MGTLGRSAEGDERQTRYSEQHAALDYTMQSLQPTDLIEGRYVLERKIGAGGYGTVWAAYDLRDVQRKPLAVKVLSHQAVLSADAKKRFGLEAELLLTLQHPGIVQAYDFYGGSDDTPCYLVLEFVAGRPLSAVLKERALADTPFPLGEALEIFRGICEAVQAAHAMDIVHRDLKPLNIMLNGHAETKVLDFGLAKLMHGDKVEATTLGRRLGSFLYMSPEQATGKLCTKATDIFGLGTLLFELLTLHFAWAHNERDLPLRLLEGPIPHPEFNNPTAIMGRVARQARPRPSICQPGLPVEIDICIAKTMSVDPAGRHPSVNALLAEVTEILETAISAQTQVVRQRGSEAPIADAAMAEARLPVFDEPAPEPTRGPLVAPTLSPASPPAKTPTGSRSSPTKNFNRRVLLATLCITAAGLAAIAVSQREVPTPKPGPRVTVPAADPVPTVTAKVAESAPIPKATPRTVARSKPRPPKRAKTSAPQPERVSQVAKLQLRLNTLRRAPEDIDGLEALAQAVVKHAQTLGDKGAALTVQRLAHSAIMVGDLDALARAIGVLRAHE